MLRILFVFLFLGLSDYTFAQKADSLFVRQSDMGWMILHKAKPGETVYSIARRYHVPPAMLADFNNISFQQQLAPGKMLFVPTGAFNFLNEKPFRSSEARPAYFKVDSKRDIARIAKSSGVKAKTIQDWNNIGYRDLWQGQTLLVGWILYDNTELGTQSGGTITSTRSKIQVIQSPPVPARGDTTYIPATDAFGQPILDTVAELSEGEVLFMEQTSNETNYTEEKGTASFFKRAGVSSNGIFFAFHNLAKRGTILKVHNPGTGKTVYAKVIGTVPTTASYHNALVGLSSDAQAELEAFGNKAWVHVTYAP